ncbi:uncharacterized protein LOC129792051 [Lutzomyia longipalpis]|uniref:uncharacterized protein LOC129792051 n=1 Tax=Lutzomyia longipalpis TaxID=7200 RepID=UPI0024838646|nr:uncharacterized protein LOC129792051 [Lutzomyia longipalpis]
MLREKLIVVLLVVLGVADAAPPCSIYLTLTPLARSAEERFLEVNWGSACEEKMWIGVFQKNPSLYNEQPIYYLETHGQPSGYELTSIQLGRLDLPKEWESPAGEKKNFHTECLPYFVAGFRGDDLVSLDCLKIQPQWQTQMKDRIGNIPLRKLFIPGTHCSGCYMNDTQTRMQLLRHFIFPQDFDVWTQLVFGVRYLDVSVGYHNNEKTREKFWIVADNIIVSPLDKLLEDVKRFIEVSGEVVILDFRDFPLGFLSSGTMAERHNEFVEYLERELKDVALPRQDGRESFDFTLNEIQSMGKTLIVTYGIPGLAEKSQYLWRCWEGHTSASLMDSEMTEYVRNLFGRRNTPGMEVPDIGWVFYGIQSIESYVGSSRKIQSARERAAAINRNLTTWLSGPWGLNANAVAIDFILSSNLLDIALHTNRHKAHKASDLLNMDY